MATHDSFEALDDAVKRKRRQIILCAFATGAAILCLAGVLRLPLTRSAREVVPPVTTRTQLREIALALANYHSANRAFPPAYTVDAAGKPIHSWRTLILPYLDQKPLYDSIDLAKPWDDPANAKALRTPLSIYHSPSADFPPTHTTYLASVGPGSFLRPGKPRKTSEITDTASKTLMLIEAACDHSVPWMCPTDADESLILQLGTDSAQLQAGGMHAAFVDLRVMLLPVDLPAETRRAMISIAGGDKWEE